MAIRNSLSHEISISYEMLVIAFSAYAVCLVSTMLLPSISDVRLGYAFREISDIRNNINFVPFKFASKIIREISIQGDQVPYFVAVPIGRILAFAPMGIMIPLFWDASFKRTAACSFVISLIIQICHLPFLGRKFDIDTIALNFLGALMGYYLYCALSKRYPNIKHHRRKKAAGYGN